MSNTSVSDTQPPNPAIGDGWYDDTLARPLLRIFTGTLWGPVYSPAPVQIRISNNYQALATDEVLNVDTSSAPLGGGIVITLPPFGTRNGLALEVNDVSGMAGTNPITVVATSPDLISGLNSVQISTNWGSARFVPFNDGTTQGWIMVS